MMRQALEEMPVADRLPFLAHAEQRAKRENDLEILRAIKDYRRMIASDPRSTRPPESA